MSEHSAEKDVLAALAALADEWAETPDEDMTCGWASDQLRATLARVLPPGSGDAP